MHNEFNGRPTANANSNWFENAVLVYGPRKSGTTLLHNLLDGGNDMFVYPEELKLKRLILVDWSSSNGATLYRKRSRIVHVKSPRLDLVRYVADWDAAIKKGESRPLKEFIRSDVEFVIDSIVGEKPPMPKAWCAKEVGGDTRAVIDWWLRSFEAPRVVFILRNPLMVTRAVLNDRRRKQRRLSIREIVRETWDPIRVLAAQKSLLDRPGIVAISYENLVADPRKTMQQVAAFLGVENGPHLTEPSIFGDPVVVRTASQASAGVFGSDARWQDGLPLRERLIVGMASAIARVMPGLNLNYGKFVSTLP